MTVELIVGIVISLIVIAVTVHAIVVEVIAHKRYIAELNAPVEVIQAMRSPYWARIPKPPSIWKTITEAPKDEPSNT